jgi:hypothetical protein
LILVAVACSSNAERPASSFPTATSTKIAPQITTLATWSFQSVDGLAWASDNLTFAASVKENNDYLVKAFDAATYQEIWAAPDILTDDLVFTPDGSELIVAPYPFTSGITALNASTGELSRSSSAGPCLGGNLLTPMADGYKLLAGATLAPRAEAYTTIFVWDLSSMTCAGKFARLEGQVFGISSGTQGEILAITRRIAPEKPFVIEVWGIELGTKLCDFEGTLAVFDHDESRVLTPNRDNDEVIDVRDAKSCEKLTELHGIPYPFGSAFDLSPDGKLLATGNETLQVWDTQTGEKLVESLELFGNYVDFIKFSPDGQFVLVSSSVTGRQETTITLLSISK